MLDSNTLPLITALCVTRNRREWLPKAIQCFLAQDYLAKEMVIVWDGYNVDDLIPGNDSRFKSFNKAGCVGTKRNYGCYKAAGSVIIHWDDDDWSAPGRMTSQVSKLTGNIRVTAYDSMVFTDGVIRKMLVGSQGIGTSLCYLKSWWAKNPFQNIQLGEDTAFVSQASDFELLHTEPANGMMYATNHAKNTSPRVSMTGPSWQDVRV